jgi:hypothetical protein
MKRWARLAPNTVGIRPPFPGRLHVQYPGRGFNETAKSSFQSRTACVLKTSGTFRQKSTQSQGVPIADNPFWKCVRKVMFSVYAPFPATTARKVVRRRTVSDAGYADRTSVHRLRHCRGFLRKPRINLGKKFAGLGFLAFALRDQVRQLGDGQRCPAVAGFAYSIGTKAVQLFRT